MIHLTTNAVQRIAELHRELGDDDKLLRISVETGGCSGMEYGMSFDAQRDDDMLLESSGVRFIMDSRSLEYMDGSEVDFDDGLNGKGFEIRNPKAQSTCGCGKSFN